VASGVSTGTMFREVFRPMFLLWAFCMVLTAASELGPQQWQESVMRSATDGKVSGTLVLVYTSAMMFVLRHFAGPIAHKFSPTGMLMISAVLACVGLYLLSFANNAATAFGYATVYGLGIAYFWPTMLGVTAERFPKGGAFLLGLMGCVGNIAIAVVLPVIGYLYDESAVAEVKKLAPEYASVVVPSEPSWPLKLIGVTETQQIDGAAVAKLDDTGKKAILEAQAKGAASPFRTVAILPGILVVIFGAIALRDKLGGGYKPELLLSREEENELFAGGAQGPVE
jgi:MFS family permease